MQSDLRAYRITTRPLSPDTDTDREPQRLVGDLDWVVIAENGDIAARFVGASLGHEVDIISLTLIDAEVMLALEKVSWEGTP